MLAGACETDEDTELWGGPLWGGSTAVDTERIGGLFLEVEELVGEDKVNGNGQKAK
jgi:hypothetical protein